MARFENVAKKIKIGKFLRLKGYSGMNFVGRGSLFGWASGMDLALALKKKKKFVW